jgi:AAA family ATP:ADP antiporter
MQDSDDHELPTLTRLVLRLTHVRPDELALVAWSCAYFFLLLCCWYVLRPVRDAMGLTGGVRDLQWLYLCTLGGMLIASPIFAALVSRFPRRVFIPTVYLFFAANLVAFYIFFRVTAGNDIVVARIFYVWASVFNLFVLSVFWSLMADIFRLEQGKRLFGLIGVGGTLGAILGGSTTAALASRIGEVNLLPVSIVLLVAACGCVMVLDRKTDALRRAAPLNAAPERGHAFSGIACIVRSPYLLGICLFLFLLTLSSTIVYFAQGTIVEQSFEDRSERTVVFAWIDVSVNVLTILTQLFLTGRIISRLGVGPTLAILPVIVLIGFLSFAIVPTLAMLVVFQVCRRASSYALAKPARESLFTVLGREEKYKAKNFIDTFIYRGGDAIGAGAFTWVTGAAVGLSLSGVSLLMLPLAGTWIVLSIILGKAQHARVAHAANEASNQ